MRRFLSIAAIVLAALGLMWVVRLDRATPRNQADSPQSTGADSAPTTGSVPSPASASASPSASASEPSVTLGRVGGKLPEVLVDPKLLVEKSRRTLSVFSAGRPVKTYRIALSDRPVGDKVRQGDRRTPEGHFYVCVRNDKTKYERSLVLSYPDAEDASRGLAARLISKREGRAIAEAIRHYKRPPYNTKLGGEIAIHGGGTSSDWTAGCMALSNTDIAELYPMIALGTPVEIRP